MIKKVLIENFKAIHRGMDLPLEPFTVFIGNNGTGKSSVIEALRVLQIAVNSDLNKAFDDFGGLDKVRNKNADITPANEGAFGMVKDVFQPTKIILTAHVNKNVYEYEVSINFDRVYVVENEVLKRNEKLVFTSKIKENAKEADVWLYDEETQEKIPFYYKHEPNSLMLSYKGSPSYVIGIEEFRRYIEDWQFLYLNAHIMGLPTKQNKLYYWVNKLEYDGANVAEYLLWLKGQDTTYWENLIQKMKFILPYIKDIEPHELTETISTEIELLMHETKGKQKAIPGWLLSSGTLRVLALLAVFESPERPSVLFVDEIENGLDPRTIGLLLNQIENVFSDKSMQVIVTTHSPYFLDMVPFESIIVSEKEDNGSVYHFPKNEKSLQAWKEKFTPGKLYTQGKLTK